MKRFSSVRSRLWLVSAVSAIAVGVCTFLGVAGLLRSNAALGVSITATSAVLHQKHADMMHDGMRADVLFAMLVGPEGDPTEKNTAQEEIQNHAQEFRDAIAAMQALPLEDEIREKVEAVAPVLDAYIEQALAISNLAFKDLSAAKAELPSFEIAFGDLEEVMEVLGEEIEAFGNQAGEHATSQNSQWVNLLIGLSCISIAFALTLSLKVSKGIVGSLDALRSAIAKIAGGELEHPVPISKRDDELNSIAKALETLRGQLLHARDQELENKRGTQQLVVKALGTGLQQLSEGNLSHIISEPFPDDYEQLRRNFNTTVSKLAVTVAEVIETSGSIQNGANEISQSSDDLSNRTESQAATLEETAAAIDELTASVKSAADGARSVENIMGEARTEAENSGKVVQSAVAAMTEIEESSTHIAQIISVIDDIAFQTNLLALNAGVEAARAGEAGRGFAVVASEVRGLAQRSADAATEIKTLITDSSKQVTRGVDLVGKAGEALTSIVDRVNHISKLVSDIAEGAVEQSTALGEINTGVVQLDKVTQQNAAMVEEATAASHMLKSDATKLAERVAHFKISGGAKVTPMYAVSTSQPTRHGSDDWEMGEAVSAATAHGNAALDKWQDF
ncbi:methyl-accepting chemotaxis protein [Pseudophaeobacter sp. A-200-2]|uniref:methyl-accepting chemotaxis protein n=1 Tax=Pseudophaeobacter sp. A-200-2 TaxID=3098145 RepID=UPI0034D66EA2